MNKICLCMIVKNESKIIERCLDSVKDIIDNFIILDTGSTDDTIAKINNFFEPLKVEGHVIYSEWKNFGHNRTLLIQTAQGLTSCDYLLLIDADMIVKINNIFNKSELSADGYYIKYNGNLDYKQLLLINKNYEWEYCGVTHECLTSKNADDFDTLDTLEINHLGDGHNRSDKFRRDIELLKQGIVDEPNNKRYYFYLAQSYRDIRDFKNSYIYYSQRFLMGGWEEEIYYSQYMMGFCCEQEHLINQAKEEYKNAYLYRPTRLEALYRLILLYRQDKQWVEALRYSTIGVNTKYPNDLLFIEKPIYDYLMRMEYSIALYYMQQYKEALAQCNIIDSLSNIPDNVKQQNIINRRFVEEKIEWIK